jgi:large subunit ribosomal protein L15
MKGQKSRSGGRIRRGFEGGQMAMIKGMPMLRGFTNVFREEYAEVNLEKLAAFSEGTSVTLELMKTKGLINNTKQRVKVLGRGTVDRPLTVSAHRFSKAARAAIEAAGGRVEELSK